MDPTTPTEFSRNASPGALRPSGGLRWHFRALWRWRLHEPFRREIGGFLQGWHPSRPLLIVVGPSAGWFLPGSFLRRFSRLILIDLDTSAPFFFRWRHGAPLAQAAVEVHWIHADFVGYLPRLLAQHPDAAVLFCNVLGQLGLERVDYEARLAELSNSLLGRPWASFHDRFSSRLPPSSLTHARSFSSLDPMDGDTLQRLGCSGEWHDHGTSEVLPRGVLRHYFPWWIVPNRFHWIEAGTVP